MRPRNWTIIDQSPEKRPRLDLSAYDVTTEEDLALEDKVAEPEGNETDGGAFGDDTEPGDSQNYTGDDEQKEDATDLDISQLNDTESIEAQPGEEKNASCVQESLEVYSNQKYTDIGSKQNESCDRMALAKNIQGNERKSNTLENIETPNLQEIANIEIDDVDDVANPLIEAESTEASVDLSVKAVDPPSAAVGHSTAAVRYFAKADDHPLAAVDHPAAANDPPSAAVDPPSAAVDPSAAAVVHPVTAIDQPTAAVDIPAEAVDLPAAVVDPRLAAIENPSVAASQPSAAVGNPTAAVDPPSAAVGHPLATVGHPLAAADPPAAAVEHSSAALEPPAAADLPTAAVDPTSAATDPPAVDEHHPSEIIMNLDQVCQTGQKMKFSIPGVSQVE